MAKNKHNAKVGSTVERSDDRIKSTGEVFTPMELVYEMIDEISDEIMRHTREQFEGGAAQSGAAVRHPEWPAFWRMLDRIDPSWKH